jgi:transposase-like protein
MAVWTEELKKRAVQMYLDGEPTPESSTELIKDIAEELDQSANGVRQVLVQEKVYVKKESGTAAASSKGSAGKDSGTKRPSKESQIDTLRAAIVAKGVGVDEDIISKLTGKAAAYFASVLTSK